jgi:hypothetical protein
MLDRLVTGYSKSCEASSEVRLEVQTPELNKDNPTSSKKLQGSGGNTIDQRLLTF